MLNLSVAAIAVDLLARPAVLRRYAADGTTTETDIQAAIQPFASNSTAEQKMDLRSVAGGQRIEDYVVIWSRTALRTADETAGTKADEVVAPDGRAFTLVSISDRAEGGFTRAIGGLAYDRGRSI